MTIYSCVTGMSRSFRLVNVLRP